MTNDSDQAWHHHAPTSPIPAARRRWPWFLLVVVLAFAGAGGVDQLAALTSKVDALQRPGSAPVPAAAITEQPHAPVAQAAAKPRKPPVRAPKPSGPISTGGAPLNVAPGGR